MRYGWFFGILSNEQWSSSINIDKIEVDCSVFRRVFAAINETAMRRNIVWCPEQLITVNNFGPSSEMLWELRCWLSRSYASMRIGSSKKLNHMANGTNYIIWEILMSLFGAQLIIKRTRKFINLIPHNNSENSKWKFVLAAALVVRTHRPTDRQKLSSLNGNISFDAFDTRYVGQVCTYAVGTRRMSEGDVYNLAGNILSVYI